MSPALCTVLTLAHAPYLSVDDHPVPAEAFEIVDVDRSIVLYDQVSCEVPEVWMTFDAGSADSLFLQVGVPIVDRLVDHRPLVIVLAEGLPPAPDDLPFDVPAGLGAQVFDTTSDDEPIYFYEPFTGTESWIWVEETLSIPGGGTGFIVALEGTERTGKLWVATGTIEDFSQGVGATFEDVWAFHEINGFGPDDAPVEESSCVPEGGDDEGGGDEGGGDEGGADDSTGGSAGDGSADAAAEEGCACHGTPSTGDPLRALAGLAILGLARRRRRTRPVT